MKLLTITVPMYNVANYIEECLKSFLVPGAEEALEVLVVNDETPDNSRKNSSKNIRKSTGSSIRKTVDMDPR